MRRQGKNILFLKTDDFKEAFEFTMFCGSKLPSCSPALGKFHSSYLINLHPGAWSQSPMWCCQDHQNCFSVPALRQRKRNQHRSMMCYPRVCFYLDVRYLTFLKCDWNWGSRTPLGTFPDVSPLKALLLTAQDSLSSLINVRKFPGFHTLHKQAASPLAGPLFQSSQAWSSVSYLLVSL